MYRNIISRWGRQSIQTNGSTLIHVCLTIWEGKRGRESRVLASYIAADWKSRLEVWEDQMGRGWKKMGREGGGVNQCGSKCGW